MHEEAREEAVGTAGTHSWFNPECLRHADVHNLL